MSWRHRLERAKEQLLVLAAALRDPRTPWTARIVVLLVVAYAVSPIDLIPDPIPILGLLDDALLLPLGIALAIRLVPDDVLDEHRHETTAGVTSRRMQAFGVALVLATWVAAIAGTWWLLSR